MTLVSDDSRIFSPVYQRPYTTVVKIGENTLELSKTKFMDLPPYVFDVDYIAEIRSELYIAVLEKKKNKIDAEKVT